MMRNVLIIAYYFPPMGLSGVQRTLKFVKHLPKFGWNPIVLTTDSPAYYAFDESLLKELESENITVYRTAPDASKLAKRKSGTLKYPSYFVQKIRRAFLQTFLQPDSRRYWKQPAVNLGKEILEKHEIHAIYSTAPPYTDFLIASELSELYDVPYLVDYRDLWVDNAYYFWATPFHKSYAIGLENDILMKAKRALVITRFMKEKILQRYKFMSHEDITIIPHGYDPEDFDSLKHIRPDSNKFTITHAGLFPDDLTPKYFLKALAEFIKANPDAKSKIKANFVGLMRNSHLKYIKKYKLTDNVELSGYVPHSESVESLMRSDVLWFMIPNNIATPSRMFEYIGARKPILGCLPDGNLKQILQDSGAGFTANPYDVKEITAQIEILFNLWKQNRLPHLKDETVENYNRIKLTQDLARELALTANY